ncbi:hypothetical protein J7T55_007984 [Diaporthe amygdali]|uniref:uncharacterized protein n=1 Tax=Phomopsis amygdali TaxID=1214568 RepID=UPI0022FE735C|nr:uncharacterized protein J7T55_007984 [Diaporthe amygdali]KAJ0114150.1 hypothetical protein J7T55_007984 [Diaporthe amygdali]
MPMPMPLQVTYILPRASHAASLIAQGFFASFVFGILLLLAAAGYRLFFHPLSRIPGPRLAAITNCWLAYHVRNGHMLQLGKTLHTKYGPAVRIGPNEVWFNTKDAFRLIYIATELLKPRLDARLRIQSPDTLDLLAERDMKRYRLQRRLIGPIYHTNNVKRYEAAVDTVLLRVIDQLRALDGSEVDLKEWMHIITVECLGAVSLSWSPGYLADKSDGASGKHAYMGWRRKSVFGLFPLAVILEPLSKHFGRAFSVLWGVTYHTPKEGFKPFFPKKITQRVRAVLRGKSKRDNRRDIMADLIQLHQDRPDEFKEQYLRRMAITNFGAGHETMTSTLISTFAMLGAHPEAQHRVAQEVPPCAGPLAYDDAVRLQLTQASIREAQRLHPVIGMALPRRVPRTGMAVHGLCIPRGTTVGCNPVSLHRSADIFGRDAEVFRPERWLGGGNGGGGDDDSTRAMERYNLIWGGGARTCPGRHLAEMLVSKIVPALVANFEVEVTMPPEDEMPYYFMAMLTGVRARFVPKKVASQESEVIE